ncbi:MAG TPA: hypothetical protein VJP78_07155 [Thermoleophilia bacterium]|nr:hypothetical protein [Thermoleophilia bacterium]
MKETVEVCGHFIARLRVPISIGSDIRPEDFESLRLQDEESWVMIRPAETDSTDYDPEDGNPPELADLTVWITKDTQLYRDASGTARLTPEDKQGFENSLVAYIGRLMQAIRRQTGQWRLDVHFPVSSYRYTFFYQDVELESGQTAPEYIRAGISIRDFINPMLPAAWNQLADTLDNPMPPLPHRDLLFDARVLRSQLRHNDAALYAGIAGELLLEQLHSIAPAKVGWLCAKRPGKKPPTAGLGWLIREMKQIAPSVGLDWDALDTLLRYRNAVAHGDPIPLGRKQATDAIAIAEDIARIVEAIAAC